MKLCLRLSLSALLLSGSTLLVACGQKGPLVLPTTPAPAASAASAPGR